MMHFTTRIAAAATALALSAGSAMAWGDIYMGDGTTKPPLVQAYNGPNYCPAGLQPVVVGGEICCGTPNTAGYWTYTPMKTHKARAHKPRRKVAHQPRAPRAYAPEGVKGVVYE